MARYIDAEKKIAEYSQQIFKWLERGDDPNCKKIKCLLNKIEVLSTTEKTADVVEVVHGEWELAGEQFHIEKVYLCTACRNYEAWGESEKTPYCPNCGAKMDGKKVE